MLERLFQNYQQTRLPVASPDAVNLIILAVLLVAAVLSARRRPTSPLDRTQTEQLRGVAILLVVVGHLFSHVTTARAHGIMAADAVALFLVLSGYALTLSAQSAPITLRHFVTRRVRRVMVPYWAITVLLLILSYVLLRSSYSPKDLLLTFAGINLNAATNHIDYVRWYVTFILVWYALFFVANRVEARWGLNAAALLLLCGGGLLVLNAHVTRFEWYQFFAFPVGCALGRYHDRVSEVVASRRPLVGAAAVFLLTAVLAYRLALEPRAQLHVPWTAFCIVSDLSSLAVAFGFIALISLVGSAGWSSRFLIFCGTVSYELFLLHGAFLIKHNPVFGWFDAGLLPLSFLILLAALLALSWGIHKAVSARFA
jgi:peptidoglycan/LPS O-acetylase OafA/YrhL